MWRYFRQTGKPIGRAFGILVTGLAMATTAAAQTTHPPVAATATSIPANQQIVYGGQSLDDSGLTLAAWGGGAADISTDPVYLSAGHSLKIVTQGLYAGGHILFDNPISLGNLSQERNRYLQIVIQVAPAPGQEEFNAPDQDDNDTDQGGPTALRKSAPSSGSLFHLVAAGGPGSFPGGSGKGMPGPGQMRPPSAPQPGTPSPEEETPALPIKILHITFQLSDGAQADIVRDVAPTDSGWIKVGLPLSALPFPATESNAQLKSMIIAGDAPATIYVGEIRLINDDTPITAVPMDEQDVAVGDEATFNGGGDGGASSLKFNWDFDTKGGFVNEAEGQNVTHRYAKAGDYKVTLMVSDEDGIKKPAIETMVVHVED